MPLKRVQLGSNDLGRARTWRQISSTGHQYYAGRGGEFGEKTPKLHKKLNGAAIWHGAVEVFDIAGHPKVSQCFDLASMDWAKDQRTPFVAMMRIPPVDTPQKAAQASVIADFKRKAVFSGFAPNSGPRRKSPFEPAWVGQAGEDSGRGRPRSKTLARPRNATEMLNPGLQTRLRVERTGAEAAHLYDKGLRSLLFEEDYARYPQHAGCLHFRGAIKGMKVEGALRLLHAGTPCVRTWVNYRATQGGAHLEGLGAALKDLFPDEKMGAACPS
jgi:hypothetical protein